MQEGAGNMNNGKDELHYQNKKWQTKVYKKH